MSQQVTDDDWRLQGQERYLSNAMLFWRLWHQSRPNWDHDHCSACYAKFAEFDGPEIQHEGYASCDDYRLGAGYEWVCRKCFDDLKDDLGWTAA